MTGVGEHRHLSFFLEKSFGVQKFYHFKGIFIRNHSLSFITHRSTTRVLDMDGRNVDMTIIIKRLNPSPAVLVE